MEKTDYIGITGVSGNNYKSLIDFCSMQGYNVRKVISEVYASFVLQCTVFGR